MKRCLFKLVVFVLLGAIVNVALAWGCGQFASFTRFEALDARAEQALIRRIGIDPADVYGITRARAHGLSIQTVILHEGRLIYDQVRIDEAGWPWPCLRGMVWRDEGPIQRVKYENAWIAPRAIGPVPFSRGGDNGLLPLGPIWGGFGLNTILFAAAIWLLSRRYVLGWALSRERNQYIAFGDAKWLGRRGATSLLVGLLLTMAMVFIYCLVPNRCLQGRSRSVGATHLGDNVIWEIHHRDGTGVTLIQSYVYDHQELFGEEMPQTGILALSAESVTPIWGQRALRRVRGDDSSNWFVLGYGWPATAFWSASRFTGKVYVDLSGVVQHDKRFGGLLLRPVTGLNLPIAIPLRPNWPGIVMDVTFNSSVVFLVLMCFALTRRQLRMWHGRCIKCSYDLGHADHRACPECGAAA